MEALNSTEPTSKSSEKDKCSTETGPKPFHFIWQIQEFSKQPIASGSVESPIANDTCHDCDWSVYLRHGYADFFHPQGHYLHLYLRLVKAQKADSLKRAFKFEFFLLDREQRKVNEQEHTIRYHKDSEDQGVEMFLRVAEVSDLLVDDTLVIYCTLTESPAQRQPDKTSWFVSSDQEISEELDRIFESGQLPDVVLLAADGRELYAHKSILSMASPVFDDQLRNDTARLEIEDLDGETIAEMLSFVYEGKVKKLHKLTLELIKAATTYELGGLRTLCESYLSGRVTMKNFSDILYVADFYNCKRLKSKVIAFIERHREKIVTTEKFNQLIVTNPRLIEGISFIT